MMAMVELEKSDMEYTKNESSHPYFYAIMNTDKHTSLCVKVTV